MLRTFALLAVALVPLACGSSSTASPPPQHDAHAGFHHGFHDANAWAKEFDDPARDAWQKPQAVVLAMQIAPGMTVADLGAGTGYFEPYLARAVGAKGKVLALDVEPDMVRYLGERAAREHLDVVVARKVAPDDPGLAPGSVDRVLIVDTWHHVDARDVYAKRLAAALAPGGSVVVVDFRQDASHGPPPEHRLPPARVIEELGGAGLSGRVVEIGLPEQYVVVASKP